MLGAGGAVESNDVDVQRFEDGEHRRGVRAEQHPAGDVQGDRGHDRHGTTGAGGSCAGGEHCCLRLEDVLLCLDDEHVDAALDERRGLLLIDGHQVGKPETAHSRVAGGGQKTCGAHAAGHESRPAVLRVLVSDSSREPGGRDIQVGGDIRLAPFLEARARGLKRAGLDDVAARVEEAAVHALDDLRGVNGEAVHPSFQPRAAEIVARQVLRLQARAHGAVENQHAFAQRVKERRSISRPHQHDVTRERLRDTLANRPFSFEETLFGTTPTPPR